MLSHVREHVSGVVPAESLIYAAATNHFWCWRCSVPGAGDEMVAGDSVGIMPQGPGQQPMGPAQLAALLRWVSTSHVWVLGKLALAVVQAEECDLMRLALKECSCQQQPSDQHSCRLSSRGVADSAAPVWEAVAWFCKLDIACTAESRCCTAVKRQDTQGSHCIG